jgi:hypothetical protein
MDMLVAETYDDDEVQLDETEDAFSDAASRSEIESGFHPPINTDNTSSQGGSNSLSVTQQPQNPLSLK